MAQSKSVEKASGLGRIFNDLSLPQVTAGALAAVTSMLLASNVGIAGTVIGVAVSSVVSAVASQVYKHFILASAEKVKDLAPTSLIHHGSSSEEDDDASAVPEETSPVDRAAISRRRTRSFDPYQVGGASVSTTYAATAGAARRYSAARGGSSGVSMGDEYARAAILQARAARERKAKNQRNVIIVAIVSAVIAVAVCALMINVATQGKGLGPQMPTATYVQQWGGASRQQVDDDTAGTGSEETSSGSEEKSSDSGKKASSQTDSAENPAKPGAGSSSTGGSSNVSPSVQSPQNSESSDAAEGGSGSNTSESESQDSQEEEEASATQGESSGSNPASTTESVSGSDAR